MRTIKIYSDSINGRYLDQIIDTLRDGGTIIYPTDTLYAFGCDALNNRAVEKICHLKGIDPKKQHLAITCADLSQAARYARIDNRAFDIMRRHLPGPFTFILPAATTLPKVFKGRKEVGIRVPDDKIAVALAESLGNPLLTSSIYLDGIHEDLSEVATMEIADKFDSSVDLMVDGGPRGVAGSAVIDLTDSSDPVVLREGPRPLDL